MVAVATIGAAAVGAASTAFASSSAASAQADASKTASAAQLQASQESNARIERQFQQMRTDLEPFRTAGVSAQNDLTQRMPGLLTPIEFQRMNQAELEQTPGYQFNLNQGLKAVQTSAAARGLGTSGAAMKGAARFATGLADSTYQQQFANSQQIFNNQQTNMSNAYSRLMGVVNSGQNAAAQTGASGLAAAQAQSNNSMGAANSIASNTIGAGNALAGSYMATGRAVSDAANTVGGALGYQGMYGRSGSGGPPAYSWSADPGLFSGSSGTGGLF